MSEIRHPNTFKVTITIIDPVENSTIPQLHATLISKVSTASTIVDGINKGVEVVFPFTGDAADPIAKVIAWLSARTVVIDSVSYYDGAWYLGTSFVDDLTTIQIAP